MGYPLQLSLRYLGSKKRASISVGTAFAVLGVTLGVAALATIMSVTGGFHEQFRAKVLGVNAHVLVLKYSTNFREYRHIMEQVAKVPGVIGVAPFSINPMMLTHGDATATGVLVKGVDPELSLGVAPTSSSEWQGKYADLLPVLDLPQYIQECTRWLDQPVGKTGAKAKRRCSFDGLRRAGAKPAGGKTTSLDRWPPSSSFPPSPRSSASSPAVDGGLAPSGRPPADAAPENEASTPFVQVPDKDELDDEQLGIDDSDDADETPDDEQTDAGVPDGAPMGAIEPDGGYSSVLPDDDTLPPDVDPDLCADPKAVVKMPGIVVGTSLAKTLHLKIGDCLTVTSPTIGFTFASGKIKPPVAKRFRVIAVFEAGFDQYDSKLVYTDLYEAQEFYDHGDTVTGVEMKVGDIDRAAEISDEIHKMLGSGLYHTMDWEELNHGLFTALRIQQIGMSAVLALIIVVAAFTVVATLIMVVLDKT